MTKIRKYTLRESFRTKTIDVPFPRYELRYPLRRLNLRQRETSRSPKSFLSYVSSFKGSEDRFRRNIGSPMFTACLTMVLASSKKKKKRTSRISMQNVERGRRDPGNASRDWNRIDSHTFRVFRPFNYRSLTFFVIIDIIWTSGTTCSPLLSSPPSPSVNEASSRLKIGTVSVWTREKAFVSFVLRTRLEFLDFLSHSLPS